MRKYPPKDEQDICIACGFCCDHTLFDYAFLKPKEEVSGHFAKSRVTINDNDYFSLPCPHFKGKCTIYDQEKPCVCSTFKCKLLKRFGEGKIDKSNTLKIIYQAKALRGEVFDLYETLFNETGSDFRTVIDVVNKNYISKSKQFSLLQKKIALLNFLLGRYFETQDM